MSSKVECRKIEDNSILDSLAWAWGIKSPSNHSIRCACKECDEYWDQHYKKLNDEGGIPR